MFSLKYKPVIVHIGLSCLSIAILVAAAYSQQLSDKIVQHFGLADQVQRLEQNLPYQFTGQETNHLAGLSRR